MAKSDAVSPQTLKGFRDLSPQQVAGRNLIVGAARSVAEQHDFEEIATPYLEYKQVLLGEGGETDKQVYLFEDSGGREVGLRYDLTIPFSRYVAANQNHLRMPFKKFQTGSAFRGEKPQKGRYREFVQADFDIIGSKDWRADVEVMQCLHEALVRVLPKGQRYKMQVSHRLILGAILRKGMGLGIQSLDELPFALLIALDKLEKIGPEKTAELAAKALAEAGVSCNSPAELQAFLGKLPKLSADTMSDQSFLSGYLQLEPQSAESIELERFQKTLAALKELGVPAKVDWSIARGLGYYTGIVFETSLEQMQELGSICSGGRYDNLGSRFGKGDLPGVGGSLGVDRLLASELISAEPRKKIMVATADKESEAYGLKVATSLRAGGHAVHLAVGSPKLAKQMQFAAKHGFDSVAIVGHNEMQTQSYTLKHLDSGKQETVKIS
jgi:histidyl-tRNA synthetase